MIMCLKRFLTPPNWFLMINTINNNMETANANDNSLDQSQFMINEKTFSIATNNVQGLSEPVKQAQIMTYVMDSKFDIFGLAETKLKFHTAELLYKNHSSYLSWWDCSEDHTDSTGVGLIFHRNV